MLLVPPRSAGGQATTGIAWSKLWNRESRWLWYAENASLAPTAFLSRYQQTKWLRSAPITVTMPPYRSIGVRGTSQQRYGQPVQGMAKFRTNRLVLDRLRSPKEHTLMNDTIPATGHPLGAADIRRIAADAGISPTKKFGQNFVIDPGTVRRIVREAGVTAADHVMEVGPGLGSLTLAILETGATMTAVEIDPPLAERLPGNSRRISCPKPRHDLTVVNRDASEPSPRRTCLISSDDASFTLVANLPY